MEIKVTSKEEFLKYLNNDRVVIDFNAKWCGPCRMLGPVLKEIAEEDPELTVLKVDTDEFNDLAYEYHVSSIPALFYVKNGKVVNSSVGYMPKPQLVKVIKDILG